MALALNADGSVNSATNPAPLGSTVSVFVNGLTPDPQFINAPIQLVTNIGWSVIDIVQANLFVVRVDLRVPSSLSVVNDFACSPSSVLIVEFTLYDVNNVAPGEAVSSIGEAFGGVVSVDRAQ